MNNVVATSMFVAIILAQSTAYADEPKKDLVERDLRANLDPEWVAASRRQA